MTTQSHHQVQYVLLGLGQRGVLVKDQSHGLRCRRRLLTVV
ncbi:hypothetical protein [Streptomyces sp. NPDC005012]